MFSLSKIHPRVFHLKFDSWRELSMVFVRYTEFYESRYDNIRENRFTLVQQMGSYCREYLGSNDKDWTYASDWSGFNIPAQAIKDVHVLGIPDPNHYDSFMLGVYEMIMSETLGKTAYLIGTSGDTCVDILRHEMTHGMFYVLDEYRHKVLSTIQGADTNLVQALIVELNRNNYPDKVVHDEINAYLTTGLGEVFNKLDPAHNEGLMSLCRELTELHSEYFSKFYETPNLVG